MRKSTNFESLSLDVDNETMHNQVAMVNQATNHKDEHHEMGLIQDVDTEPMEDDQLVNAKGSQLDLPPHVPTYSNRPEQVASDEHHLHFASVQQSNSITEKFTCKIESCGKFFPNRQSLASHITGKHKAYQVIYRCNIPGGCPSQYQSSRSSNVKQHLATHYMEQFICLDLVKKSEEKASNQKASKNSSQSTKRPAPSHEPAKSAKLPKRQKVAQSTSQ